MEDNNNNNNQKPLQIKKNWSAVPCARTRNKHDVHSARAPIQEPPWNTGHKKHKKQFLTYYSINRSTAITPKELHKCPEPKYKHRPPKIG